MIFYKFTVFLTKAYNKVLTSRTDKKIRLGQNNLLRSITVFCFINLNLFSSLAKASEDSCLKLLAKQKATNVMAFPIKKQLTRKEQLLAKAAELREINESGANIALVSPDVLTDTIAALEQMAREPGVNEKHQKQLDVAPLVAASKAGDLAVVRSIIEAGEININQENTEKVNALYAAAAEGHIHIVSFLLEQDLVNASLIETSIDPLVMALENDHIDVFKLLLNHKTSRLIVSNSKNNNVLMIALEKNLIDVAYLILDQKDKGLDLNLVSRDGDTALTLAIKGRHFEFAEELIKNEDIQINPQNFSEKSALVTAVELGKYEFAKKLILEKQADINAKHLGNKTVLLAAAENGDLLFVNFLLNRGEIQINEQSHKGYTALIQALESGFTDVSKVLLEHANLNVLPAKINSKNALVIALKNRDWNLVDLILNKQTELKSQVLGHALVNASATGELTALKFILNQTETDVNFKSFREKTALLEASYNLHLDIIKILMAKEKIQVNLAGEGGHPALHHVIYGKSKASFLDTFNIELGTAKIDTADKIVALLLSNNDIDVNIFDQEKGSMRTALMIATEQNYVDTVRLLLEHQKTNVNLQSIEEQWSPLMMAIINDNLELVKLFLDHRDIDLDLKDADDNSVLDLVHEISQDNEYSSPVLKEIRRLIFLKMNE